MRGTNDHVDRTPANTASVSKRTDGGFGPFFLFGDCFQRSNVALPIARKGEWVVVRFEQIVQRICPMVEFQLAFGSRDRYTPNKLYGIRPNLKSVTKR
jgi:hypothetical protein